MVNNAQRTPQALEVVKQGMNLDGLMKLSSDDMQKIVSSLSDESRIKIWKEIDERVRGNKDSDNAIAKMRYIKSEISDVIRSLDETRNEKIEVSKTSPAAKTDSGDQIWRLFEKNNQQIQKNTHNQTLDPSLRFGNHADTQGKGGLLEVQKQISKKSSSSTRVRNIRAHADREYAQIEVWSDGNLTASSVVALVADLDNAGGVERWNRRWLTRLFFWGTEYKQEIGEQQLLFEMRGMDQSTLNDLYNRVTGDTSGIVISQSSVMPSSGESALPRKIQSFQDLDTKTQQKVIRFQRALVEEANTMAELMSILLWDTDARAGLRMVITGEGVKKLENALDNPDTVSRFQQTLEDRGILKEDPRFIEKVASALMRIGVSAGFTVLSQGMLMGYMESTKLTHKDPQGVLGSDGLNLSVRKDIGRSGGSIVGSVDLVWLRANANWNDPEARIRVRNAEYQAAEDKMSAAEKLAWEMRSEVLDRIAKNKNTKSQNISHEMDIILSKYLAAQRKIIDIQGDQKQKNDALNANTHRMLTSIEALQWFRLKGVFAAVNMTGFAVGLSAARVERFASNKNIKIGAGHIEGEILGRTILSDNELMKRLSESWITKKGSSYLLHGKPMQFRDGSLVQDMNGKKIVWNIHETNTAEGIITDIDVEMADVTSSGVSQIIHLQQKNNEARNPYIEKNNRAVADAMLWFRRNNPKTTEHLQNLITGIAPNYDAAAQYFLQKTGRSKNSTIRALRKELLSLNTPDEKRAFFDLLQDKTSWGRESRHLAQSRAKIEKIRSYYEKIAPTFAKQYGISQENALKYFDKNMSSPNVTTLGEKMGQNWFTALVAYSQIHGKNIRFQKLDRVEHTNARIIGNMTAVDKKDENIIRQKLISNISDTEAQSFIGYNNLMNTSVEDAKKLMVAGPVYAYLSYSEWAECYNLGFAASPATRTITQTSVEPVSTYGRGSTVMRSDSAQINIGFGVGARWQKPEQPKNPDNPNPPERGQTSDPENGTEPWRTPPGGEIPEGEKPVPEGEKPVPEGEKPVPEGEKPVPEGEKPVYTDPVIDGSPNVGSSDVSGIQE